MLGTGAKNKLTMRYRWISLLILLFGAFLTISAYAQGDPGCERIEKAKSDDRAALIDEIIKSEYAKPNLQGRLGAGLVCLATLGDEEQNKVFLELLSKASAISRSHTAWFIAVELKVKPSEEVFGALRNLIGWTKPDGDRQDATHWSREALIKWSGSSPTAGSYVIDALKEADACFGADLYQAAKKLDLPEARVVIVDFEKKLKEWGSASCD